MLPDYVPEKAVEPKRKPAPAKPARPSASSAPAPREAVQAARSGAQDLYRLLSFAPPEFDPSAVVSARAQLMQTLQPKTAAEVVNNPMGLGLGSGTSFDIEASQDSGHGLSGTFRDSEDKAREQLAGALRSQRREALGVDKLDFTGRRDKVEPLTTEQYEALDPRQKQAIDFNTMLVQAVRRDRKNADEYTHTSEEQRDKYDKLVSDIFGEDRGSDHYAPETVALLKQIGFDDPNADLDDFLSLKAAIHAKDVKRLAGPTPTIRDAMRPTEPQPETPDNDRLNLSRMLAAQTGRMQETLAQGNRLLQTMRATATADRSGLVDSLGGQPAKVATAAGFGGSERDAYFQDKFNKMLLPDYDVQQGLAAINQNHPEDLPDFLAYVSTRLGNADQYGVPLGVAEDGVKYRSPEQIRKELGLDGGR